MLRVVSKPPAVKRTQTVQQRCNTIRRNHLVSLEKSQTRPQINFVSFISQEFSNFGSLVGQEQAVVAASKELFEMLKFNNVLQLKLSDSEAAVYRTLLLWFGIQPYMGLVFRAAHKL